MAAAELLRLRMDEMVLLSLMTFYGCCREEVEPLAVFGLGFGFYLSFSWSFFSRILSMMRLPMGTTATAPAVAASFLLTIAAAAAPLS